MRRVLLSTAVVMLWICASAAADAGEYDFGSPWPPPAGKDCRPSREDIETANTLHKLAEKALEDGDYDGAARFYRDAYKSDCTRHEFLRKLAFARQLDDDYATAVQLLRLYLDRMGPDSTVETQIERFTAMSEQAKPAPITSAAPAPPAVRARPAPSTPPPAPDSRRSNWRPWALMGGGAAVTVTGLVLTAMGQSYVDSIDDKAVELWLVNGCTSPSCPEEHQRAVDQRGQGSDMRAAGIVMMGVGVATVAGGLVWYLTGSPRSERSQAAATVSIGVGSMSLSGTF